MKKYTYPLIPKIKIGIETREENYVLVRVAMPPGVAVLEVEGLLATPKIMIPEELKLVETKLEEHPSKTLGLMGFLAFLFLNSFFDIDYVDTNLRC